MPRPAERPARPSLVGPAATLVLWLLLWLLLTERSVPYVSKPIEIITGPEWWTFGGLRDDAPALVVNSTTLYYQVLVLGLGFWAARVGGWAGVFRYFAGPNLARARLVLTLGGALLTLWLVWTRKVPLADLVFPAVPTSWMQGGGNKYAALLVVLVLYALIGSAIAWPFARTGHWSTELGPFLRREPAPSEPTATPAAPTAGPLRAQWPDLRAAGSTDAAEALTAAVYAGRMNDVDCVRVRHAWTGAGGRPDRLASFTETVLRKGADAFLHPSGFRDVPGRTATHDPLTGQVRIGECADDPRNPYPRRGSGMALEPASLATSLLAVGPPGSGKTERIVRPVVEALALRALTGQAAVLAVGGAGGALGPDDAYDVVIRIGDPASLHDFDLYGGTTDPDEAAAALAEGLAGDIPTLDTRRAATALGQLLGPFRTVHGRFPAVPELRELLEGSAAALDALREALEAGGHQAMLRELEARARQAGSAADPAAVLADRVATLDRPAFAGFFATGEDARPFSLRALGGTRCGSASTCRNASTPRRPASSPGWCSPSSTPSPPPAPTARCSSASSSTTPPTPSAPTPSGASAGCGPSTPGPSSPCAPWTTCPRGCTRRRSARSAAPWSSPASPPGTASVSRRHGARSGWRSGRLPSTASSPTSRSPAPCTHCARWPPARPSPRTRSPCARSNGSGGPPPRSPTNSRPATRCSP